MRLSDLTDLVQKSVDTFYGLKNEDFIEFYEPVTIDGKDDSPVVAPILDVYYLNGVDDIDY